MNNAKLICNLDDGSTLVGSYVCLAQDSPNNTWMVSIRSIALGTTLDIDARYIVQYRRFLFWKSVNFTLFQQATSTASDFNNYDLVGRYNDVAFCRMDDARQFTYDHEKYLVRGNQSNKPVYHPVTHYRVNLEELTRDL